MESVSVGPSHPELLRELTPASPSHPELLRELTPDRWLMQSVLDHSASGQAREVASAWIAAYDTALALGAPDPVAHLHADAAYLTAARRVGL